MKSWNDISYCIVTPYGIVGSYALSKDGSPSFTPMLLRKYNPIIKLARKLTNITKVEHKASLYDSDSGAVLVAPEKEYQRPLIKKQNGKKKDAKD